MSDIKRRGFGSMDKDRLRELSRAAGQKAQASGKAHRWTRGTEGTGAAAAFKGAAVRKARRAVNALAADAQETGTYDE